MSEIRTIRVRHSNDKIGLLSVEVALTAPWKLAVSGPGLYRREFQAEDLFDALVALRIEVEKTDARLLCAGARIDVFPSGMSRSMGGARKAYITRSGVPATEIVDIFDPAEPELIGTVPQQREFHANWIQSLMK